jgi:hypothetical protein
MNQPDDELARRIIKHLDAGVDQLDPETRDRLRIARERALGRYRERPAPVLGLAWAGQAMARVSGHRLYSLRNLIAVTALVLGLAGLAIWNTFGQSSELADIDAGLLTDELPINAYLDKGFDSWLKRAPR